jgi:hypothetical protein
LLATQLVRAVLRIDDVIHSHDVGGDYWEKVDLISRSTSLASHVLQLPLFSVCPIKCVLLLCHVHSKIKYNSNLDKNHMDDQLDTWPILIWTPLKKLTSSLRAFGGFSEVWISQSVVNRDDRSTSG